MLPFLDRKKITSILIKRGDKPLMEAPNEMDAPENDEVDPGLESAAEDILRAVESRSARELAKALKAAFEMCGNGPEVGEYGP